LGEFIGRVAWFNHPSDFIPFNINTIDLPPIRFEYADKKGEKKVIKISLDPFMVSHIFQEIDHREGYKGGETPLTKEFIETRRKNDKVQVTTEEYIAWLEEKIKAEKKGFRAQK